MPDKREKRFRREHRPKNSLPSGVRLVYRPKTQEEVERVCARADECLGSPFMQLPGEPPQDQIVFSTTDGTPIPVKAVEMVFNDACLLDYAYGAGHYWDTSLLREREVLEVARRLYGMLESAWKPSRAVQKPN